MSTRAYALLTIKDFDDGERVISGIASTPEPDRMGDIVEPLGITVKNPIPLLLYHDKRLPVGTVTLNAPTKDGVTFSARLPKITEPGALRERVTEAWQSIRAGLIKGISIGFRPLKDGIELMREGGLRFKQIEVLELSLVAVPANATASIAMIKSADEVDAAALSRMRSIDVARPRPGATGLSPERKPVKTKITDQITAYTAERTAKVARMNELAGNGETLDAAQAEEFDTLTDGIAAIDKHLSRLAVLDRENVATAKPVNGATDIEAAASRDTKSIERRSPVITVRPNLPPGIGFARAVLCRTASWIEMQRGQHRDAVEIARERYPDDSSLQLHLKAAVPAATTSVAAWAGVLVDPANLGAEFLEYVRPQTIIGRIPGLTTIPFNVRVVGQTTGGAAYWVGEAKPKPLTKFDFAAQSLGFAKVATTAVISEELARFSSPNAETLVRNGLAAAVIERLDIDFIDPAKAAVANVSPASITNGVAALPSSGNTPADVLADIKALLGAVMATNGDVSSLVLLMPNSLALSLSMMTNDVGDPAFATVGMSGGTLAGIPVITSQYLVRGGATGSIVVAAVAKEIMVADDGQVTVDMSREASLEMDDAPTAAPPTGAALVSLWQNNLVGLRAERFINWGKRRANAVAWLTTVAWGEPTLP